MFKRCFAVRTVETAVKLGNCRPGFVSDRSHIQTEALRTTDRLTGVADSQGPSGGLVDLQNDCLIGSLTE